ncbi:predicted protein [Nematostella vectensis]|uniref:Uncharacterized protein n=1 Tax=Nematostella vectensis TaxID=45351 RepID=A7RNK4_NEMVE|nr:predicted protein [Nematostella vectensis]|eukprot:XP_001639004.1 predicted protein [Nematostella vectensis]
MDSTMYIITGDAPDDFICNVCGTVMLVPVVMPNCGHSCCSSCAKRVNRKCPECREEFGATAELRENISLKRIIRRLQAKCKRCPFNGELGLVLDHLCPERETECTNPSCNVKVKRSALSSHLQVCPQKMTECAECQKRMPRALLERHSQYECFQRMVQCVLCTENVKRDGLNLHLTNCEERSRTCGVPGCHFHGNQEQMLRHRVSYASGHVELYRTYAERLAHAIAKKSTPSVEKLPLRVETFLWCTEAFKEKAASACAGQPLTSPTYRSEAGEKWRLVLFVKPYKLYAQLQSSVAPLNVNIR